MQSSLQFLVVDFHAESRFLLIRTLLRKFPGAIMWERDDADEAVDVLRRQNIAAVITHRTFDVSGTDLVRLFRGVDPRVPIVMVSGIDREQSALDAGATSFLHYDEWLRVGSVVEEHLVAGPHHEHVHLAAVHPPAPDAPRESRS